MACTFGKFRVAAIAAFVVIGSQASADSLYINEMLWNPPSNDRNEYFEVRLDSGSWTNKWFVALENEDNNYGQIDFAYNLATGSASGAFKVFAPSNHQYATRTSLNETVAGTYTSGGALENSGFTALIIDVGSTGDTPAAGDDWDTGSVGLSGLYNFEGDWNSGWSVLDAIGVVGEIDDAADAALYADINFGTGPRANLAYIHSTAAYVNVADDSIYDGEDDNANFFTEIEYAGRYGNSTGTTAAGVDSWMIANITDQHSGYSSNEKNWGISGTHSTGPNPESVLGDNVISPHAYGHVVAGSWNAANSTSYTPEPSSLVMLALASVAMATRGRRA